MAEAVILCEKNGAVATMFLNRPEVFNTMNRAFLEDGLRILAELERDQEVRVLVITGQGRGFCAGGDLSTILALKNAEEVREFITLAARMATKVFDFPKPVISMVNGVAAGAGFNLAIAADIVIAERKARFGQSFSAVGLHPDAGGLYLLPRLVGLAKAKELMFTADLINADEAKNLGIVNHVYDQEDISDKTYALAQKLASAAPLALKLIKQGVNRSLECSWETLGQIEINNQVACWASQDGKEGIKAFVEKRAPKFVGH